jgi:hypothetical protein
MRRIVIWNVTQTEHALRRPLNKIAEQIVAVAGFSAEIGTRLRLSLRGFPFDRARSLVFCRSFSQRFTDRVFVEQGFDSTQTFVLLFIIHARAGENLPAQ